MVARTVSQELCPIKVIGETLECVNKFGYLGVMIGPGSDAEEASRMREMCTRKV